MRRYTLYVRERIINLSKTLKPSEIVKQLESEGFTVSKRGVQYLINRYSSSGSLYDRERSGRPLLLSTQAFHLIDQLLENNDELTTRDLQEALRQNTHIASLATVGRCRQRLGWTSRATRYCQLIRAANKLKRVDFCKNLLDTQDTFDDVVFTDEAMVVLTPYVRRCYHKKGQPRKYKPKPKYPTRVLIWGGISRKGATRAVIFTGIMDAQRYVEILQHGLLPFIRAKFPNGGLRFQQDNDPKHTSRLAKAFFLQENIFWWRTPPESPDLNPQERVWAHLKQYLCSVIKPRNKSDLVNGIKKFWSEKLTVSQCNRYISHLKKVIPKVIEKDGGAVVDDDLK